MTKKILIDTDILIDISRGIKVAINRINQEEIKHQWGWGLPSARMP